MPTTMARNGAGASERIEVDLPPHVVAVIDGYRMNSAAPVGVGWNDGLGNRR